MSRSVADYSYHLPEDLIATRPTCERDGARMMVIDRAAGSIQHLGFRDVVRFVRPGDLVVLNNSRVIKARLLSADGRKEIFLLEDLGAGRWKCLTRPGRKMRPGATIPIAGTEALVVDILPGGERIIAFADRPDLEKFGHMPLPPYFNRPPDASDEDRYQTVFAGTDGSVAAPTAGLHFTPAQLGVLPHAFITLHVGAGTFLPVKAETLDQHIMHEEAFAISPEAAQSINRAGRVLAVGTTVTRVLESRPPGPILPGSGRTSIFIHPPYHFQRVGALLTNFHLPESTLLMLVCAFAGYDLTMQAYAEAIKMKYRFYSYGDCMLIL